MRVESKLGWMTLLVVIFVLLVAFMQTCAYGQVMPTFVATTAAPPSFIAYDASSSANWTLGLTVNWVHTFGTISDGIVLVFTDAWYSSGWPSPIPTVTVNGNAATYVTSRTWTSYNRQYLHYYVSSSFSGNQIINVTFASGVSECGGIAMSFSSVNQTSPVGGAQTAMANSNIPISVSFFSSSNEIIAGALSYFNATPTDSTDQTRRVTKNNGVSYASMAGSTKVGGTSTFFGFTNPGSSGSALIAIPVKSK